MRLPVDFAAKLYKVTKVGTTVVIADNNPSPSMTTKPGLLFDWPAAGTAAPPIIVWQPEKALGPVSMIISAADGAGYIYRNGVEIGRAPIAGLKGISGVHAFSALATANSRGQREWLSVASIGKRVPDLENLAKRTSVDATFLAKRVS